MRGRNPQPGIRWCMSQWIFLVIYFIVPHSEAVCQVTKCNLLQCDENSCDGCYDGYYLQIGASCIPCYQSMPGCVTCSSSTSCSKCTDGYYLQSGSCIQCQRYLPGCATCRSSTSCTKCNEGYYLQYGRCYQCSNRCSTCTSSTQCTICKDTYWRPLGGCSSTCSTNCTNNVCDATTGYCYGCKPGTYGPTCGQDCNLCKDCQCDLRKCTIGCKDGYYQVNAPSPDCYKCVYDNCLACSNETYCTQCEHGYHRNYYRQSNGRGTINCLQCDEKCMGCISTEYCLDDCVQHCNESVNPGTTMSTHESNYQRLNNELYEDLNSCQQQIKTCRESEDQYQLTFGHGLATGIGICIVLFGSGVGIALFIKRRTKPNKHENKASDKTNEYVNTDMSNILSVIASENNEVTNDIPTVSSDSTNTEVTNIDSSKDYVSLGDRQTHESKYSDLQNT